MTLISCMAKHDVYFVIILVLTISLIFFAYYYDL